MLSKCKFFYQTDDENCQHKRGDRDSGIVEWEGELAEGSFYQFVDGGKGYFIPSLQLSIRILSVKGTVITETCPKESDLNQDVILLKREERSFPVAPKGSQEYPDSKDFYKVTLEQVRLWNLDHLIIESVDILESYSKNNPGHATKTIDVNFSTH
jgi:hypothetical protein